MPRFIQWLAAFAWLLLTAACFPVRAPLLAAERAPVRPNILWVIAEDLGPDLGCYGNADVATPNLDRLASQGCRYTRAFSTAPVCSAARSALMTGEFQTAIGAQHHRSNRQPHAPVLPAGIKLLTDRFHDSGYFTANLVQFPETAGIQGKGKTDWNFAHGRRPFDSDNWQDLRAHQPFFAQVNFSEAHRIYHKAKGHAVDPAKVSLPPYLADDPLVREDWAAYLDAIQTLDAEVGAVLDLLAAEGLAENTVVMFMGDNGREDFRGKYHLYEQGTSVPLIIRAPRQVKPGSVSDELVSGVDLSATTLALAGIALPAAAPGKPLIGPQRERREYLFTALDRIDDNFDRVRAVRDARWKYLRNFEPSLPYVQDSDYSTATNPTYLVMRKLHAQGKLNAAQSKFMARSRPEEELYDLDADPYELHNLASSPAGAQVLARLRGQLQQWMHSTGDDRAMPEPRESLDFSRQQYEANRARAFAKNLKELRANYAHLAEVEPIVQVEPAAPPAARATPSVEIKAAEKRRPNLLFIMTDQHHYEALGCADNPIVKTPNLDRLAAGGTQFVNSFCVVPYCSPTRAAIVTGRYPASRGLGRNIAIGPNRSKDPLRLHEPCETYLHHLAALGYHCHQLGKWHLGDPAELNCFPAGRQDENVPIERTELLQQAAGDKRFDESPRPGEVAAHIEDTWMRTDVADAYRRLHEDQPSLPPRVGLMGRSALKTEFWPESVLADYCIELLKRHRDEPFAITYSISPPHEPFIAPARFYDLYEASRMPLPSTWDDRPSLWAKATSSRLGVVYRDRGFREYVRCYYARVTLADEFIGRILKSLDELGLTERTLVVFTSDHGNMMGQHGMMEKSTGAFYDDLMRVPLLVRFPGRIPAGKTCPATASSVDLAPTILDCLGAAPLPDAHGRSLLPLVASQADDDRPAFGARGEPDKPGAARMIRTRQWKLCLEPRGQRELFDLQADPAEVHNLADDPALAGVINRLSRQLLDHMRSTGDAALAIFQK